MSYGWNSKYGNWERVGSDKIGVAIPTIDYAHYEIHGGSNFYVKGWQDVADAGSKLWFWWEVPNVTKQPHALWTFIGEDEFNLKLFLFAFQIKTKMCLKKCGRLFLLRSL
jgi:hypothetical protein